MNTLSAAATHALLSANTKTLWTTALAMLLLSFGLEPAIAAVPTTAPLPSGASTGDPMSLFVWVALIALQIIAGLLAIIAIIAVGGNMISAFNEAVNSRNGWGKFLATFFVGLIVIVVVVFLAVLAIQWAGSFTGAATVSFG